MAGLTELSVWPAPAQSEAGAEAPSVHAVGGAPSSGRSGRGVGQYAVVGAALLVAALVGALGFTLGRRRVPKGGRL
jgi:hypothetical protein